MLNINTVKPSSPVLKKILRYSLKVIKIVLLVLVILFAIVYVYISANKKKIIAQITEQLSEKIDGKVSIRTADISFFRSFPRVAVYVQDASITDTMFSKHQHTFFAAKEVFANINIFKFLKNESALSGIRVRNGSIFLYTDTAGYTNTYLLRSKKDPAGGPKKTSKAVALDNIWLQQMQITKLDEKKGKLFDFNVQDVEISLQDEGDDLAMRTEVSMIVSSMAFNTDRGSFLKGARFKSDFNLKYGKQTQVLSFNDITVYLSGDPFVLSGTFDLGEKNPGFTLKVKAKHIEYDRIKKLLPAHVDSSLSKVSLTGPFDAEAELYGPLRGGEPYIIARWHVKDAVLKTQFMDFDRASFNGYFKNEVVAGRPRKDPNSVINISDFNADWHGLPVNSGNIEILNLQTPQLTCDLYSGFPLTDLNELLQSGSLQLTAGTAAAVLSYKGPVERNNNSNSFLNGVVKIKDGKILYAPRNVEMTDLNGDLSFRNSNVVLQNLQCKVLGNAIIMNGTANNILTLISSEPNKVVIDYNIYSPALNLASFTYLLQSRQQKKSAGKNQFGKFASQLDEVLDKSRVNVDLKADAISYKKFSGAGLRAGISILQDRYLLNNVNMQLAGGSMALKGELLSIANGRHQATLSADLNSVNVQQLFYAFENFGQDGVTDKNLEGILTAKADVGIQVSNDGKVLPSSSAGNVDFSLKKAVLHNFEPIKKIQNFIFKKRDFDNIEFAELKNRLTIKNGEININRMEIQSSVLSFFVEGLYSPRGNTDISVQVPFNNLKKRGGDYKPENIGTDKKGGRSIFLRGQPGKDGNIDFKLDLFKRYQKDKGLQDSVKNG